MKWYTGEPHTGQQEHETQPGRRAVRQWQYEHSERRLPDAPRSIGNWSAAGLIWRHRRRRKDQLADAARRMADEKQES